MLMSVVETGQVSAIETRPLSRPPSSPAAGANRERSCWGSGVRCKSLVSSTNICLGLRADVSISTHHSASAFIACAQFCNVAYIRGCDRGLGFVIAMAAAVAAAMAMAMAMRLRPVSLTAAMAGEPRLFCHVWWGAKLFGNSSSGFSSHFNSPEALGIGEALVESEFQTRLAAVVLYCQPE